MNTYSTEIKISATYALLLAFMLPVNSYACTLKSGKDCQHTAGHKADHKVKLGKTSPAGNIGSIAHTIPPVLLGSAGASAAIIPNPAKLFLLMPRRDGGSYLIPFDKLPPTQTLVNTDGTLTTHAIDLGIQLIKIQVPGTVVPAAQQIPTAQVQLEPQLAKEPNQLDTSHVGLGSNGDLTPAPLTTIGLVQVRYEQKEKAADGSIRTTGSFTYAEMALRGLVNPDGTVTSAGATAGISRFMTPLPGVQYATIHNGREIILSERQVQVLHNNNGIRVDGTLSQRLIDQGFTVVIQQAPTLFPKQVAPTLPKSPEPVQLAIPQLRSEQVSAPEQQTTLDSKYVAPRLAQSHVASNAVLSHIDGGVEVYHPLYADAYAYEQATQYGDLAFHLIVVGFKEPN